MAAWLTANDRILHRLNRKERKERKDSGQKERGLALAAGRVWRPGKLDFIDFPLPSLRLSLSGS